MKTTGFIFISILFYSIQVVGQSLSSTDYIVSNSGDTISGKIVSKIKPGVGKVKFATESGGSKTYYPRQIKSFCVGDSIFYQSILQTENADAQAYEIFACVITRGYLNLLATHNKTGSLLKPKDDTTQQEVNNYYLQDSRTEAYFKLSKMSYRKQLADRVDDYKALRREVMNKVYKYDEIPEVIELYNAWKSGERKEE